MQGLDGVWHHDYSNFDISYPQITLNIGNDLQALPPTP